MLCPVCWAGLPQNNWRLCGHAANRRIGEVSQNIYYPGRLVNRQMGGNYAMKSAGSPTGMAMGGFDDLPFLGGVLDLNRIRYTVTNPGVYLSKAMVGEARELTGRKRKPPPEITGPMTEEEDKDVHGLWPINQPIQNCTHKSKQQPSASSRCTPRRTPTVG